MNLDYQPPWRICTKSRLAIIVSIVVLIAFATGCDDDTEGDSQSADEPEAPLEISQEMAAVDDADITDLTAVDRQTLADLTVGPSTMYDDCHELLLADQAPRALPDTDDSLAKTFFGCGVVDHRRFDDGRRVVAFEEPMADSDHATDLRIVAYDPTGQPLWDHRLDRSHQRPNFLANHVSSYLSVVDDRLVCGGTRWTSNTQLACLRLETGNVVYEDHLDFYAGLDPFGYDGSLFSADRDGITRRYPFTGQEMRHRDFEASGGRSAFYATEYSHIFFVPEGDEPILSAWDLETYEPIWKAALPATPRPRFYYAAADHDLLVFLVDQTLIGVDTATGAMRFAFAVGESRPKFAHSPDELFILIRSPDIIPAIHAVDPRTGAVRWSAEAPTGALSMATIDDQLVVRSVRTVRPVTVADDGSHE